MKPLSVFEARMALMVAHQILDIYFSAGEDGVTEEEIHKGNVVEVLGQGHPALRKGLDGWTFVYNASYVPSCCAGECVDFDLDVVGHVDITTAHGKVYQFSLDILCHYEWDV